MKISEEKQPKEEKKEEKGLDLLLRFTLMMLAEAKKRTARLVFMKIFRRRQVLP